MHHHQKTIIGRNFNKPSSPLVTLLAFTPLISCQSGSHNHNKAMIDTLDHQQQLIEAVINERKQPNVTHAVSQDGNLSSAESHLSAALQALNVSNKKLKEKLNGE